MRPGRELVILALSLALYLAGPRLSWILEFTFFNQAALKLLTMASGLRASWAMFNLWALQVGRDVESRAHLRDLMILSTVYSLAMLLMSSGALSLMF